MLGPFQPSQPRLGGLLWKIPWRLSAPQKARQRKRLRAVDQVIAVVDAALARQQQQRAVAALATPTRHQSAGTQLATASQPRPVVTMLNLQRWKDQMPSEAEMLPRDKYTIFDRKEKRYRKGIHSELFLVSFM